MVVMPAAAAILNGELKSASHAFYLSRALLLNTMAKCMQGITLCSKAVI